MGGRLFATPLLAMIMLSVHPAGALPVVSEMRVTEHQSLTRVMLTLNQHVDFKTFTLPHPHRVVVDMPEVGWTMRSQTVPTGGSIVDGLRHGRNRSGTSRLVIDCRKPVMVRDASLQQVRSGVFRLVIAISEASAAPGGVLVEAVEGGHVAAATPAAATTVGGVAMQPVIGSTGLAIGDIGPSASIPTAIPFAVAFGTPKPRPKTTSRNDLPKWVVAIDAGHGGQDPGAISLNGEYEKRITLATARALRDELRSFGRYRVLLTRDRDVFIRLRDRIAIARAAGAELFVSIARRQGGESGGARAFRLYTFRTRLGR